MNLRFNGSEIRSIRELLIKKDDLVLGILKEEGLFKPPAILIKYFDNIKGSENQFLGSDKWFLFPKYRGEPVPLITKDISEELKEKYGVNETSYFIKSNISESGLEVLRFGPGPDYYSEPGKIIQKLGELEGMVAHSFFYILIGMGAWNLNHLQNPSKNYAGHYPRSNIPPKPSR
jgi:hypothetical protein